MSDNNNRPNKDRTFFIRDVRPSHHELIVKLSDDAPQWLKDAVYEAHMGMLPNDWVFDECSAAMQFIRDCEDAGTDPHDSTHEHADSRVDVYTKDLYSWAHEFCLTDLYSHAKEEARDVGDNQTNWDIDDILHSIQYCAIRYITDCIVNAYRENKEDE